LKQVSPKLSALDEKSSGVYLSGLYVYPIKSCGGVAVGEWEVGERGLRHDRRWMLVDETGRFMSQRQLPRMARIGVRFAPDGLIVDAPGMSSLEVPFRPPDGKLRLARVWDDLVEVSSVGAEADRWLGECLGARCRLVHLPDRSQRPVDPDYGRATDRVALADAFPFHLISATSLAELNTRLEQPLPIDRFRPNLVVGGCEPFAEDGWGKVRIGPVTLHVVKPCARCVIITVDQRTATKTKEPLRTLATFRRKGNQVLFGQNLVHDGKGILRAGSPIDVSQDR
jgi:uncharacterized protein